MDFFPGLQNLQNIHPLFVHFPIALISVTLFFEGLWWLTKKNQFRDFATYLSYLSTVSVVVAVITGYIASDSIGHEAPGHDFVHEHRDVMLWMSGVLLITVLLVIMIPSFRAGQWRRLFIVPLLLVSALLVYGADKGGRLVFEFGVGVKAVSEQTTQEGEHEHEEESEHVVPQPSTSLPDSSTNSENHTDGVEHVH